jgi:hypothetical protein
MFVWIAEAAGTRIPGVRNPRTIMRAHHVIAIVVIILIGFGLKLTFFSVPPVEADALLVESVGMDPPQIQQNIPEQKIIDMTFVFPGR